MKDFKYQGSYFSVCKPSKDKHFFYVGYGDKAMQPEFPEGGSMDLAQLWDTDLDELIQALKKLKTRNEK